MMKYNLIIVFVLSLVNLNAQTIEFKIEPSQLTPTIERKQIEDYLDIYSFTFDVKDFEKPIIIKWEIAANDMHSVWTINYCGGIGPYWDFEGDGKEDAEIEITSDATFEAPIMALISYSNTNSFTYAASDALNSLGLYSGVREEDGLVVNKLSIDPKAYEKLNTYTIELRVDQRKIPYWQVLSDVSDWWASFENFKPLHVPEIARLPMYST